MKYLSQSTTNKQNVLCTQRKFGSALAAAQFVQDLRYPLGLLCSTSYRVRSEEADLSLRWAHIHRSLFWFCRAPAHFTLRIRTTLFSLLMIIRVLPSSRVWNIQKIRINWQKTFIMNCAATWQNQQNECAPSKDSDQGGCPGWSESSLGAYAILMVLSWGGSIYNERIQINALTAEWESGSSNTRPIKHCIVSNIKWFELWFFFSSITDKTNSKIWKYVTDIRCRLISFIFFHMSYDMTKLTKWVCAQGRLRSAWASAQSDQTFRCAHNG